MQIEKDRRDNVTGNMHRKMFGCAVSEICFRADTPTDRQTDRQTRQTYRSILGVGAVTGSNDDADTRQPPCLIHNVYSMQWRGYGKFWKWS